MMKYFIIAALLIVSCHKEETKIKNCITMNLSHALPVEFFLNGVPTYNELISSNLYEDEIEEFCFYQHFGNNDTIRVRFANPTSEGTSYSLIAKDKDGERVYEQVFTVTASGSNSIFEATYNADAAGLSDKMVQLFIVKIEWPLLTTDQDGPGLEDFDTRWTPVAGSSTPWTVDPAFISTSVEDLAPLSNLIEAEVPAGGITHLKAKMQHAFNDRNVDLHIIFLLEGVEVYRITKELRETSGTTTAYEFDEFYDIPDYGDVQLQLELIGGGSGSTTLVITEFFLSWEREEARTDFIKFGQINFATQGIYYKSSKSFAAIPYPGSDEYFYIRIPGSFFHENDVLESKEVELSNNTTVSTASKLKKQKLLSMDDMTDYMHTKIALILQHGVSGSVKLNEVEWIMAEEYKKSEDLPYSYPLKPAEVYLTRKNYLYQNVM